MQLGDDLLVLGGVLADIQCGEWEADRRDDPDGAVEDPVRCQLTTMGEQIGADQQEIVEELPRAVVVAPLAVRTARPYPLQRETQAHPDDRQLEPDRLLGVDAQEAGVEVGQESQIVRDGRSQLLTRARDPFGHREVVEQSIDVRHDVEDGVLALEAHHILGHRRRDEGIPVPVSTDPGTEADGTGVRRQVHTEVGERAGEVGEHLGERAAGQVIEVVERVACLVEDLRTLEAQLVGLPQQVDDLG